MKTMKVHSVVPYDENDFGSMPRGESARQGDDIQVIGRTAAASARETRMGQTLVECVYNGNTIFVDEYKLR